MDVKKCFWYGVPLPEDAIPIRACCCRKKARIDASNISELRDLSVNVVIL